MKFFVSGQIDNADSIRKIMDTVIKAGHEVTHDWTMTDTFLGGAQDKLDDTEESGRRASKDIEGIIACDVYILSSSNTKVGKGMYVELGAALALHEITSMPKIYIIGSLNYLSVFYLHPAVIRMQSIDDVLSDITT